MGFFDIIKKITTEKRHCVQQTEKTFAAMENKTDAALLKTGEIPAKPSIRRKTLGYRNNVQYEVSFLLSGDFIEFNSHCELEPSYQYEPLNQAAYTGYQENYPEIFFGVPDAVYDAIEEYHKTGTVGKDFTLIENSVFLFKTRIECVGDVLWIYAFSAQSAMEENALCLQYHPDIVGTPLEQKLLAILDEAAKTYVETKTS